MKLLKTVSYSFWNGCGIELSYLLLGVIFGTIASAEARPWWPVWAFGFVALYWYIGRVWWKQVKSWKDNFKLAWWQLLAYKMSTLCLGIILGSFHPVWFTGWLSVLALGFIVLDLITAAVYLEG